MRVSGIQAGVVMALAAVAAGEFFEVRPPDAYGICMACHGRDLLDWLVNNWSSARWPVSQASLVFPLLTTVGVLIGGFTAAVLSGEFRWHRARKPLKSFAYGVLVMNFALLAAGCATRLLLRTAAGDLLGLAGFAAMVVGVILATYWLRWRALR
ncbi:MAG: hypothetical protein A2Z12_04795 [Actinobacteria bacterium RBG_16_68_21]|nr:MAG: hypothetical protein A2Z12_04795 [Actinobacteria bacterium RBG_16_68_21]